MRRQDLVHIIPMLMCFALVLGVVFFVLNSSRFLLQAIPPAVAPYLKPYELESLKIGRQKYRFPRTVILNDVQFSLTQRSRQIDFSIRRVVLHNLLDMIKSPQKILVDVEGLEMQGGNLRLHDVSIKLFLETDKNRKFITYAESVFNGGSLAFDLYHFEAFKGRMNVDSKKIEVLDLSGRAYGGDMKGQFLMDRGLASYIVWAELSHLRAEKLSDINAGIFSQVQGELNGAFRMKNEYGRIEFFTAELSMDKGGQIGSPLIEKIISESASLNKEGGPELIIKDRPQIFFDNVKFYVQNNGRTKMKLGVEFKKKDEALNIRALHDIETPDGIELFLLKSVKTDIFSTATTP